ncbi:MAG: Glutathione S-transferase domain protein [Thermoleophilia bacterium]|nr:Glutathione S-transferase domain protein [Thermoleophilia bacterium]
MDDVTLYGFPGSNACLTAELLLEHAGVAYREHRVKPGPHALGMRLRGFSRETVPAIRVGTHLKVQGTRPIASWIAQAFPDAHLLPEDPVLRERVLAAEHDGERLQNAARRTVYVLAQDRPGVIRPLIDANFGRFPGVVRGGLTRAMVFAASKGKGASRARLDSDLTRMAELLDGFDALVEEGVLGSETPNVADFQIAPNLAMLAAAPSFAAALKGRPSWRIAERICPTYPLEIDVDAPADWAARLAR